MHAYRSHTCGQLRAENVGQTVRLSSWIQRKRDHGNLLFIDLRDHYGLTQLVIDPDSPAFAAAEKVRSEWVIRVDGEVKVRGPSARDLRDQRAAGIVGVEDSAAALAKVDEELRLGGQVRLG